MCMCMWGDATCDQFSKSSTQAKIHINGLTQSTRHRLTSTKTNRVNAGNETSTATQEKIIKDNSTLLSQMFFFSSWRWGDGGSLTRKGVRGPHRTGAATCGAPSSGGGPERGEPWLDYSQDIPPLRTAKTTTYWARGQPGHPLALLFFLKTGMKEAALTACLFPQLRREICYRQCAL